MLVAVGQINLELAPHDRADIEVFLVLSGRPGVGSSLMCANDAGPGDSRFTSRTFLSARVYFSVYSGTSGRGPHQAHFISKYVEQLWKLIHLCLSKESPYPRYAGVALCGDLQPLFVRSLNHGAQLENLERAPRFWPTRH